MPRPHVDLQALPFPVLFADIGGTNARFAILSDAHAELRHFPTVETRLFATVEDALEQSVIARTAVRPRALIFAVAGPIQEERTPLTNCPWVVEPRALIERFDLDHVILFNDFEALALALPSLEPKDLIAVGGALPPDEGTKVVIGPGTGLGAAGLVHASHTWVPVPGEGGHIDLAPVSARDQAIWPAIERHGDRVSGETIVCGSGMLRLYRAIAITDGVEPTYASPAEITAAAEAGDPRAVETLDLFAVHLGRVAGSLALTFLAHGGVYLAGGIAPRIAHVLHNGGFRRAFEDKWPHEVLMKSMATAIVVHERPALAGLVSFARTPTRFGVQLDGRHWIR
ncbi:ROK family protein [Chthonobacter albigriseus]|uniref:ROK family protein n=1 Tax=Chthonobacter albigriseus TaxID=1683161 RepID=UPI0015EFA76B|nr:glucokinase [Chthonobacter albigriseus]